MIDFALDRILQHAPYSITLTEAGRFTICTANADVEGETIYVAIIVETRNPLHDYIISDFEKMSDMLTEKP